MTDDAKLPDEAAQEVIDQAAASAATETEQPAEEPQEAAEQVEDSTEAESDDSPSSTDEEISESKKRRERRKQYIAELKAKEADVTSRLDRIKKAGEADQAPKEDDFEDFTEYAAAKAVWAANQKTVERETALVQAETQELEQQRQREIDANWLDASAEARTRLQNYDQVVQSLPDHMLTDVMVNAIKTSDAGPDVAYHLGANPAVAARISSMSDYEQVFELGRLSATLTAPKPKVQSQAPEPIKPVGGQSRAQRDPSKMTTAEYFEWRKKGGGR